LQQPEADDRTKYEKTGNIPWSKKAFQWSTYL